MKSTRFALMGDALGRALTLLCAILFVSFSFMSCQQEDDEEEEQKIYSALSANDAIIGDWVSSYGEKYAITQTDYDNYYTSNNVLTLYYSTTDIVIYKESDTSGFIYGKFDDADHIGYGATVGQWYALRYTELTSSSVTLWQPYKAGGKAATDTLDEAVAEFTVANGYYASGSECTK